MGLQLRTWVEKQYMQCKHTEFPVKKKFQAQRSIKKIMLTVFWGMKGPITIDFLKNISAVNSDSYY